MKKNILSLIFILTICSYTQAQDVLYGGLRLSPNFSVFTDKAEGISSGVGYSIGYFEVAELSSKINLQAEINYSNYAVLDKVPSPTATNPTRTLTRTTRYTNLELPLMVKYRIVDAFSIGAGYQFNILNSEFRTKSQITEGNDETTRSEDGISTAGYFIDANYKAGSTLIGLRILQNDELYNNKRSINVGLYVGFTLFK
jgi:hypothetical protein